MSLKTLSRISFAALLVKVMAKIREGSTPSLIKFKIRCEIVFSFSCSGTGKDKEWPGSRGDRLFLPQIEIHTHHYSILLSIVDF
jgi:hypothetical protein